MVQADACERHQKFSAELFAFCTSIRRMQPDFGGRRTKYQRNYREKSTLSGRGISVALGSEQIVTGSNR